VSDEVDGRRVKLALLNIASALFFIMIAWYALQALKIERILHAPNSPRAKLLRILLSVVIGTQVSEFFTNYLTWFNMLQFTFSSSSFGGGNG
jgi:uncharacterized integral membrane protein (TIGR02327 family)